MIAYLIAMAIPAVSPAGCFDDGGRWLERVRELFLCVVFYVIMRRVEISQGWPRLPYGNLTLGQNETHDPSPYLIAGRR